MKKIILLTAFAISTGICSAQISFGFQAGANFGMGKLKYDESFYNGTNSHYQKNKMKVGLVAGFVAEIPISSQIAFRPELNFLQEGTKQSDGYTDIFETYAAEQKITLNYIQLPLNVIYKMPIGPGTVFFGLGPAVQFGISGKDKYTSATDPDENHDYKIKFDGKKSDDAEAGYYDNVHLKRFDVAVNVLAGYKLGMGVFVKLAYSHGFMDINPDKSNADQEDRSYYKNSGFSFSVGYMFGGAKKK